MLPNIIPSFSVAQKMESPSRVKVFTGELNLYVFFISSLCKSKKIRPAPDERYAMFPEILI